MELHLEKNEILKDIQGYQGRYAISSFGRVYSYVSHKWLKPTKNFHGGSIRYYVNLGRGTNNRFYIHRLVAETFIPNPENKNEVDHIDTDPSNNHVENLRWTTRQENMNNALTREKTKTNKGGFVEIINLETGEIFLGYEAAAKAAGVCKETIRKHVNNKVLHPKWQKVSNKRIVVKDPI